MKEFFSGLWNTIRGWKPIYQVVIVMFFASLIAGYFFYDNYNDTKVRLAEAQRPPSNWRELQKDRTDFINKDSKSEKLNPSGRE